MSIWFELAIASQFSHKTSLQRFLISLEQLSAFAIILAVVVFPTPRIPVNKYALGILFCLIEFIMVSATISCPIRSSNI